MSYEPNGKQRRRVDLDLPAGSFVVLSGIVGGPHSVLLANICDSIPQSGEVGCATAITPVLFDLAEPQAEQLPIDLSLSDAESAAGEAYFVGHDGNVIYLAQVTGSGGYPGVDTVRLLRASLDSNSVEEVKLPEGVASPQSICASGDYIAAAVPVIDSDLLTVERVDVHVQVGGEWAVVGEIVPELEGVADGFLRCTQEGLAIAMSNGAQTELLTIISHSGDQWTVSERVQLGSVIPAQSGEILVVADVGDGRSAPQFYQYERGRLTSLTREGGNHTQPGPPHLVLVGTAAYDASSMYGARPDRTSDAPAAARLRP